MQTKLDGPNHSWASLPVHLRRIAGRGVWLAQQKLDRARAAMEMRRMTVAAGVPHGLPSELIISLTSYPARFPTLHLTLRSLLSQSVRPDRLLLWLTAEDIAVLPSSVTSLSSYGLEVRPCEDVRSFKKLIFAVQQYPAAYLVTADDDLHYPANWLQDIVSGVEAEAQVIVARRVHRLTRSDDGRIAPYMKWRFDVQDASARRPSADIMATSGAGALYPPGCLPPIVSDRAYFEQLCPDGDDLWFYWTARMAGSLHKKVGGRMPLVTWPNSQASALWDANKYGGNDRMIRALEAEFGSDFLGV